MGHSYAKKPGTTKAARTPAQWTEQVRHKYCGALDMGRKGKPNKVHRCEACLAIKARQSRGSGGEKAIKEGRQEKMSWHLGGGGS
ncbi:uncharacterized protein C8A04DRAFT_27204 [Dichotomopilus funicola]|uniref:Uncharacterized protein n=1 Tax=Dichotomopilus funicola TaxID=1934379 RepID=A0AAN6V575_9PEZI|nr:hypothetical protein C8A04DRAFT_27204 [Dichotomopilus funicola]